MVHVVYRVRSIIRDEEINNLIAASWSDFAASDWTSILAHSLIYVCAYSEKRLIGFVNVAWDGGGHAFVLDTTVHPDMQRCGIGTQLVKLAVDAAREHNVEWIHVDYEPHLESFYRRCGFLPTKAGLIRLNNKQDATS